jgi:Ca2+-binding EF-hand superfamily protein
MKAQAFATVFIIGLSASVAASDQSTRQAPARGEMRFRGMDQNRDGVIARTEWRGSDRSFRTHDWNGDGVLSGDEVRVGAAREQTDEEDYDPAQRPIFRNWTERGFKNVDRNADGRITRAEWYYDREAFVRADRNGDGSLTRPEFLGEEVDLDREDRFEYLDANNDNRIQRSEWHGSAETFQWLDRNNDDVLSRTEVVGEEADESDLFASLDVNNDAAITSNEWHWSRRSFTRQDVNGDGRLTRRELTNAELAATNTVGTSGRTIVVNSTERWIDTGLDVRSGDTIPIQASGTVTLSNNGVDTARPAGAARRATAAPLPDQPAGALIAKIENGPPMFVGDRATITANTSGRLYLGINDDHLPDNRGEYRVMVQRR